MLSFSDVGTLTGIGSSVALLAFCCLLVFSEAGDAIVAMIYLVGIREDSGPMKG